MDYYPPRADGLIRIFVSAKVDHLSRTDGPWAAICGLKPKKGRWSLADMPYPGTHLCRRCEQEASNGSCS